MVVKLKYNEVLYVRNLSYVVLSDLQPLARPMGNPKGLNISICNAETERH